jgi:hypothetical protein
MGYHSCFLLLNYYSKANSACQAILHHINIFFVENTDAVEHRGVFPLFCHSEGLQRPKNLTDDKKILRYAQNDKVCTNP